MKRRKDPDQPTLPGPRTIITKAQLRVYAEKIMRAKKSKKSEVVKITYMIVFPEDREDLAKAAYDGVGGASVPFQVLRAGAPSVPLTVTSVALTGSIVEITGEADA